MFPDEADLQLVMDAMFDPFEYFIARHKDGLLKTDFKAALGRVSYHIPCHGRVQKIGKKTEEMFKLIGQMVSVQLNTVERCSGHAGTYGVKTQSRRGDEDRQARLQGHGAKDAPDFINSDCALAGHHIEQGTRELRAGEGATKARLKPTRPSCPTAATGRRRCSSSTPDVHERKRELARLIGIEDRMFAEVEGQARLRHCRRRPRPRERREDLGRALPALRVQRCTARRRARRRGRQARLRPYALPGACRHRGRCAGQHGG